MRLCDLPPVLNAVNVFVPSRRRASCLLSQDIERLRVVLRLLLVRRSDASVLERLVASDAIGSVSVALLFRRDDARHTGDFLPPGFLGIRETKLLIGRPAVMLRVDGFFCVDCVAFQTGISGSNSKNYKPINQ